MPLPIQTPVGRRAVNVSICPAKASLLPCYSMDCDNQRQCVRQFRTFDNSVELMTLQLARRI
jgi:hypothetical protein